MWSAQKVSPETIMIKLEIWHNILYSEWHRKVIKGPRLKLHALHPHPFNAYVPKRLVRSTHTDSRTQADTFQCIGRKACHVFRVLWNSSSKRTIEISILLLTTRQTWWIEKGKKIWPRPCPYMANAVSLVNTARHSPSSKAIRHKRHTRYKYLHSTKYVKFTLG